MVESFAIDAFHVALRDKCVGVNVFDKAEDVVRFAFLGQDEEHLDIVSRIKAGAVEDRHASVHVFGDMLGNLFMIRKSPSPNLEAQSSWR